MVLKDELMQQCRNVGPRAFIGQDEISAEGYVMGSEFGTFKLVDRRQRQMCIRDRLRVVEVSSTENPTIDQFECT